MKESTCASSSNQCQTSRNDNVEIAWEANLAQRNPKQRIAGLSTPAYEGSSVDLSSAARLGDNHVSTHLARQRQEPVVGA